MPFLFVQLANFNSKGTLDEGNWPLLREAQAKTVDLGNTAMVVTIDIGNAKDIHPRNKQEVGRRLALAAFGMVYKEQIVYKGPTYDTLKIENDRVRISFKNTGGGLVTWKNDVLKNFIISGEDRKFVEAEAFIDGNTVIVMSDKIKSPIAVRYAWSDAPEDCNFYNIEGLPTSPFRTDVWDDAVLPVIK
jgi:sialate O-acetylesterase